MVDTTYHKMELVKTEGEGKKWTRLFEGTTPVVGAPFCSKSRLIKNETISWNPGELIYEHITRTPDVPYGESFYLKETWAVYSTTNTA